MKKIEISVVIPCYRSENTIEDVVENTIKVIRQRTENFEIILVNDASPDNVWDKILSLSKKYNNKVIGLSLSKNFGQHAALMAGYNEVQGDVVVSMDDDGQTNPNDLWKLVDRLYEGKFDTVCAKYPENKESLFRRFGSWVNDKMAIWLIKKPKHIKGTSYSATKNYIIKEIVKYDKSFPYVGGLVYRVTSNIGDVEIKHLERKSGKSGYTLKKLVGLIMNGFTAFSVEPLRISSYIGFVTAFLGFIYGIVTIIRKLTIPNIQLGYSSIIAILLFSSGIIMLMLGLIGEYIGRIYICINKSPQYVIKERTKKYNEK